MAHAKTTTAATEGGGFWAGLIGDLFGAAEVEVEEFGDKLGKLIPDGVKKNKLLKRLFGVAKARIEKAGHRMGGVKGEFLGRLADILDFALQDTTGISHPKDKEKEQEWLAVLIKNGQERFLAAQPKDKAAVLEEVKTEIGLYRAFYSEALGIREEIGKPPVEHKFDWSQVDDFLGQAAAIINGVAKPPKQPSLRTAPTIGASGLPPIGGSYAAAPPPTAPSPVRSIAGTTQFIDATLGRAHRGFNSAVRTTVTALIAVAALIGLSLWWSWSAGLTAGILAAVLLPIFILYRRPTSTILLSLAWWNWGPGGVWNFVAGLLGVLVTLRALLIWWPIWWPPEGVQVISTPTDIWHTVVLGVLALVLFVIAGMGPMFRDTSAVIGGSILLVAVVLGCLYGARWIFTQNPTPSQTAVKTHVLVDGEDWTLPAVNVDIPVTAPAGMQKGACIRHVPDGVQNFWTDSLSGKLQTAANCDGRWRMESPKTKAINDGHLLAGIGVRNPGDQEVTFAIHSRR